MTTQDSPQERAGAAEPLTGLASPETPRQQRPVALDKEQIDQLVATLGTAVRRLGAIRELDATLDATVAGAVDAVPGADRAGVSAVDADGSVTSRAPTDELVRALDLLQAEVTEGPCIDALGDQQTVLVGDLRLEHRWPRFAPRAVELGQASVLSFRLSAGDAPPVALNLYSSTPHAFDEEALLIGEVFASHAALALAYARNTDNLAAALNSRDLIGQAKGILMERLGISASEAFARLVESSQETNLKVVEVARWLTGSTPERGM